MTANQVASALSFREFQRLCSALDEKLPPAGPEASDMIPVVVGGRTLNRKFDVVKIQRQRDRVNAFVDLGKGVVIWMDVESDEKSGAVAA